MIRLMAKYITIEYDNIQKVSEKVKAGLKFTMSFLSKIIGFGLLIAGMYFLSKNIIFTIGYGRYWWVDLSAALSVLTTIAGVLCLCFIKGGAALGWWLIGLSIIFVYASSGVILRPTSLWTFFVAFACFMAGFKLMFAPNRSF
jgi:hypothetical protein